jgi:murein DD-endopeptidase MepM/ murein hydrolase activator NlpD
VAAGKVVYVGWMRGFGQLVILDHDNGHHTLSAHLSKTQVSQGQRVDKGQIVGASGDTGSLSGAKLYFELRDEGRPINPIPYMR